MYIYHKNYTLIRRLVIPLIKIINTSQQAAEFWLTTFVYVLVVAERIRTWADRPQTVSGRPMLIHTTCAVALRSRFQNGMVGARQVHAMSTAGARHGMCKSSKVALCKSNGKDTI